jgi:hypothetical protein
MSTKIVKLSYNIELSNSLSVLGKAGGKAAWGNNALQTITVARRTPFNPQQAIGYKGIVDYTSSPVTSDLTLDCILTEQSIAAGADTSIYKHAEAEVILGEESYVLTSCAMNFQAGNPATVNFGYITSGLASALLAAADPDVLMAGEEAVFAVIMGEDGSGIKFITEVYETDAGFYIPAGVQTVGFNSTLNRNQILDVRKSSPIQFITTYPLDISMNMELLQPFDATNLKSLEITRGVGDIGESNSDGFVEVTAGGHVAGAPGATVVEGTLVKASGLKKSEESESVNTSGNVTYSYSYTAADLQIPLTPQNSNS